MAGGWPTEDCLETPGFLFLRRGGDTILMVTVTKSHPQPEICKCLNIIVLCAECGPASFYSPESPVPQASPFPD